MKIKLYGVESCPNVKKATEFLRTNKIKFEFVKLMISQPKVLEDLHARSGLEGDPQLCLTNEAGEESFILGFNEQEYRKVLIDGN